MSHKKACTLRGCVCEQGLEEMNFKFPCIEGTDPESDTVLCLKDRLAQLDNFPTWDLTEREEAHFHDICPFDLNVSYDQYPHKVDVSNAYRHYYRYRFNTKWMLDQLRTIECPACAQSKQCCVCKENPIICKDCDYPIACTHNVKLDYWMCPRHAYSLCNQLENLESYPTKTLVYNHNIQRPHFVFDNEFPLPPKFRLLGSNDLLEAVEAIQQSNPRDGEMYENILRKFQMYPLFEQSKSYNCKDLHVYVVPLDGGEFILPHDTLIIKTTEENLVEDLVKGVYCFYEKRFEMF